jgi:hypothetical protein
MRVASVPFVQSTSFSATRGFYKKDLNLGRSVIPAYEIRRDNSLPTVSGYRA